MCAKISEYYADENKKDEAAKELNRGLNLIKVLDDEDKISRFEIYANHFKKKIEHLQ